MGSSHWLDCPSAYSYLGVDEMIYDSPRLFLSLQTQKLFSKLKNIFQGNFLQQNFSPWPERVQRNFLAFQSTMEVLMNDEKTQEDNRQKYQDYPSA